MSRCFHLWFFFLLFFFLLFKCCKQFCFLCTIIESRKKKAIRGFRKRFENDWLHRSSNAKATTASAATAYNSCSLVILVKSRWLCGQFFSLLASCFLNLFKLCCDMCKKMLEWFKEHCLLYSASNCCCCCCLIYF